MLDDAKRRLVKLEAGVPSDIVLELRDGTSFHYSGSALLFFSEALREVRSGGGPITKACLDAVDGTTRIWQLVQLLAMGPIVRDSN